MKRLFSEYRANVICLPIFVCGLTAFTVNTVDI